MQPSTPHYQKGSEDKIAFIFSCPGKCEERECRPVAKTTGKNLETLMAILNKELKSSDFTREKVTITNSWSRVEYPEKTGRSEAKLKEILVQNNLERLYQEIKEIKNIIICSGINARKAIEALIQEKKIDPLLIKIAYLPHLGTRGINMTVKVDRFYQPILPGAKEATYKRLEKLALDLIPKI